MLHVIHTILVLLALLGAFFLGLTIWAALWTIEQFKQEKDDE